MKLYTFLIGLFCAFPAWGTIVTNSVSVGGGSNVVKNTETSFSVYGSFLGRSHSGDTDLPYDSCQDYDGTTYTAAQFLGCNTQRVSGSTLIRITFNDDVQFQGQRQLRAYVSGTINNGGGGGTPTTTSVNLVNSSTVYTQGSTYEAVIRWQEICDRLGGQISTPFGNYYDACTDGSGNLLNGDIDIVVGVADSGSTGVESPVNIKFTILTPDPSQGLYIPGSMGTATGSDGYMTNTPCPGNINGSDTGANADSKFSLLCDFAISPGDDKLKLVGNTSVVNSLRFLGNQITWAGTSIGVKGVRVFTSNDSFQLALPGSGATNNIDFRIPGDNSFLDESILEASTSVNGRPVFARMGAVDLANNVTHLTSDFVLDQKTECNINGGNGANSTNAIPIETSVDNGFYVGYDSCPYATVPSAVNGILDDDLNCFVATALRNSSYDYQVVTLRMFRDRFLKTNALGRKLVKTYYTYGPYAAQWLDSHSTYKPFFRIILWPIYLFAKAFTYFGFLGGLVFMLILVVAIKPSVHFVNSLFKP